VPGPRELDRGGKPIRTGPDDDRVDHRLDDADISRISRPGPVRRENRGRENMTRSENERIPKPEARVSCAKGCRSPRDLRGDRLDHHGNVAERLIELGEIIGPRSHRCDQDLGIGACWKDLLVGTGGS